MNDAHVYEMQVQMWKPNTWGVTTMKSSSIALFSYLQYSSAYELEYSCLVIIMIYELAHSLCVLILTCSTLCLTIHMICMSRTRARLRWQFVVPSGLPMSYACRSIGLESLGDMGSFFVHGRRCRCWRSVPFPNHQWSHGSH